MPETIHDVAVVGDSPVGQLLAPVLGRRGHDVLVLERWPQPYDKPRAVRHGGFVGLLDLLTGAGFTLLTDGVCADTALPDDRWSFLDEIDATVGPISTGGRLCTYADSDDGYLPWLRAHGWTAAMVRPDFYFFGAARTPEELRDLVDQLREQLRTVPRPPESTPTTTLPGLGALP
ncbi:FAD binding domain-containing protein [Nocardia amikacinitolerans]|uniref:FAD-dependent monooxygenase n=1 Tax=Nocardia amikacinitolerans TaxID=756689 RepID=UPI00082ED765|nr:FAD-dependent monooxygenase [Nocardia amikacinitolerans]MCP2320135.1 FAD binding domain-containing protein [Nocardia amikacinitolerans]